MEPLAACVLPAWAVAVAVLDCGLAAEPDEVHAVSPVSTASAATLTVSPVTLPRVRPRRRDIDMPPIMPEPARCLAPAHRTVNVAG
jgi:hypothetical protein